MKQIQFFSILAAALVFSACSLPFFGKDQAGLHIEANETATIYLDDKHVGTTTFDQQELKAGQYTLKMVSEKNPNKQWQTNVRLTSKVITVVSYNFADHPDQASYYVLQLEKLANQNNSEIAFITQPDNVIITLDGQPKGLSPVTLEQITPGEHRIVLSAPAHQEMSIPARSLAGYSLLINAQLARLADIPAPQINEATASAQTTLATSSAESTTTPSNRTIPTPKPTVASKPAAASSSARTALQPPYVIVQETGTGWLRVRDSAGGEEVAKVDTGEQFPYIDSDGAGWYKIEYASGKEGWVVSRYTKLVE
jgi:hypothetical protein